MSYGKNVRQFGTQEVPIIDIVKPIAKYAKVLEAKDEILEMLEEALRIAISGRPGPVWLDIPLDYQYGEDIDIEKKFDYQPL